MIDRDSPLSDDEEEILVYVDFEGTAGPSTFCNEKLELDMIGLDSEHPIMQVNGKYYEGTYEDAVGTYMFFDKDTNAITDDPVFDKTPIVKYYAKARKILKMRRVFVKPRHEVLGDSNHPQSVPNISTIKTAGVPSQYQEKALELWKEMRNERLEALNVYLEKQRQREEKRQKGIELDSESDDDNPFAMYKPTALKSEENSSKSNQRNKCAETANKNDPHTLTVIDPGPSTSMDSISGSILNIDTPDNLQKYKLPMEPKNQGCIQILTTRRPKKSKKKSQKKKSDKMEDVDTNAHVSNKECYDRIPNNHESNTNEKQIDEIIPQAVEEKFPILVEGAIQSTETSMDEINDSDDNMVIDETQLLIDEDPLQSSEAIHPKFEGHDKKIEKQRKRDAKMNEISERLRKIAAEMKPKI